MQLEIYQWLVPLISIFFITRTILQFYRKRRTVSSTIIWIIFWGILILLAIIPNELSVKLAQVLGIKSNINAIFFVALGLIFLFIFYLSAIVEKLEIQLTELVRKQAIDKQKMYELQAELDKERLMESESN